MAKLSLRSASAIVAGIAVWAVMAAVPAHAADTLTVTPSTNFVDNQTVAVSVVGGVPYWPVSVSECVTGGACSPFAKTSGNADGTGTFTGHVTLDALVYDVSDQVVVDCRASVTACSMVAVDNNGHTTATVPLAFDPSAPLRPSPTATASSTTGLTDNQIVQLTGSGFDPHSFNPRTGVEASVCPSAPAPRFLLCNDVTLGAVDVDASGSLSGSVALRAVILHGGFDRTETDCRVHACELRIGSTVNDPLRSLRIPLTFLAAAPLNPPRVTATPSTDLADGQKVLLSGERYPPLMKVVGLLCIQGTDSAMGCELGRGELGPEVTTSATGTFETEVTVHRVPEINTQPWDCGPDGRPCELAGVWLVHPSGDVYGAANFTWAYAATPVSFTAAPSPPQGTGGATQGTGATSPPASPVSATPTFTG